MRRSSRSKRKARPRPSSRPRTKPRTPFRTGFGDVSVLELRRGPYGPDGAVGKGRRGGGQEQGRDQNGGGVSELLRGPGGGWGRWLLDRLRFPGLEANKDFEGLRGALKLTAV